MKLNFFRITLILMTLFFFYEYMIRGYKVLIKDEEITLFPDNMYGLINRFILKRKMPYNSKREKTLAYVGVFIAGSFYAFLTLYFFVVILPTI